MHWELKDPEDIYSGGWRAKLDQALAQAYQDDRGRQIAALLRRRDEVFGSEQEDWERENIARLFERLDEEDFSPTTLSEVIYGRLRDTAELRDMELPPGGLFGDHLAARVAHAGLLVFEAIGSPHLPQWTVYSALDLLNHQIREQVALDVQGRADFRRITDLARSGDLTTQEALDQLLRGGPTSSDIPWEPTEDETDDGQGLVQAIVEHGFDQWPRWASIPLHRLGTVDELPVSVTDDDGRDVSTKTREYLLRASQGQVIAAMDGDEVLLSEALEKSSTQLQDRANRILNRLMPQAPTLRFQLTNPNHWFAGPRPTWRAILPSGDLALERLSEAESRWSRVAISLAMSMTSSDRATTIVILDEPEVGLHGHAEARLSQALTEVSRESQCMVLVATHSAALLDSPAATKHHLAAGAHGQLRSLRLLDADLVRAFRDVRYGEQEVGLTPAEILQMVRVFVVVEGPHDQVVLEHLLSADLSAAGAVILHAAGAKNLPELTRAQLIWDYTDADVVVVLDNLSVEAVLPVWEEAKRAARSGARGRAREVLRNLERLPGGEPRWLRELLERAIATGHWERVHPHPLSMPDIVCYLPPDAFGLTSSWDDLIQRWRGSAGGRTPADLKGWLTAEHRVNLGLRSLRRAVKAAVPVRELQELGLEIRVLAGMRDMDPSP
jgi:energy-coupling factor transporter ATP-binding protein EcfA2